MVAILQYLYPKPPFPYGLFSKIFGNKHLSEHVAADGKIGGVRVIGFPCGGYAGITAVSQVTKSRHEGKLIFRMALVIRVLSGWFCVASALVILMRSIVMGHVNTSPGRAHGSAHLAFRCDLCRSFGFSTIWLPLACSSIRRLLRVKQTFHCVGGRSLPQWNHV